MAKMASKRNRPRLGQHFLRDDVVRDRIIEALPRDDLPIIEVGAGQGVLTGPLAALGRPLVAVELDERLANVTRGLLRDRPRCRVVSGDILDLSAADLLAEVDAAPPYGLAGNLPYAITAPLLRKFLSEDAAPAQWLLVMLQREVAEQVVAEPGKRSLLSISVQFYAQPEILFRVGREAFEPLPKVRSALLLIRRRAAPCVAIPSEARFFEVVRAGFRAPRKQLHNALSLGFCLPEGEARRWLERCEIDPVRRPGTLTLEEWARLTREREAFAAPLPDGRGVTA